MSTDTGKVLNPLTNRYIKKGGLKHKQLVADKILGLDHNTRGKNAVLAKGNKEILTTVKTSLATGSAIDKSKHNLSLRKNKLIKTRKAVGMLKSSESTKNATVECILNNRGLIRSKLSDEELTKLLDKIIDMKMMGKSVNVNSEYNELIELNAPTPTPTPTPPPTPLQTPADLDLSSIPANLRPPKLTRQIGRYKVLPIPTVYDSDDSDGYEASNDDFSDSDE